MSPMISFVWSCLLFEQSKVLLSVIHYTIFICTFDVIFGYSWLLNFMNNPITIYMYSKIIYVLWGKILYHSLSSLRYLLPEDTMHTQPFDPCYARGVQMSKNSHSLYLRLLKHSKLAHDFVQTFQMLTLSFPIVSKYWSLHTTGEEK